LIDLGQRLLADQPLEAWDRSGSHGSRPARAELALIADGLGMSAARLEPLAVLCCRLHQLPPFRYRRVGAPLGATAADAGGRRTPRAAAPLPANLETMKSAGSSRLKGDEQVEQRPDTC
jgi:hypothetical protein